MAALKLPTVTLCAAASVNVRATVAALSASLDQVEFAECLLFTHQELAQIDRRIRVVRIERLGSARAYSEFLLRNLVNHIHTSHCLIAQWDGFVIDAGQWDEAFLWYDYIGAPWPQFHDGYDVGNGGFSLRSRKLLDACRDPRFQAQHPEDIAIGRTNRSLLEIEHGISFPDRAVAERFSLERSVPTAPSFGFHGIFNMIPILGAERFWGIYWTLDERSTAATDYWLLMRQLGKAHKGWSRQLRLTFDVLRNLLR